MYKHKPTDLDTGGHSVSDAAKIAVYDEMLAALRLISELDEPTATHQVAAVNMAASGMLARGAIARAEGR